VPQPNESAAGKQIKHNPLYYKITINENLLEEHSEALFYLILPNKTKKEQK